MLTVLFPKCKKKGIYFITHTQQQGSWDTRPTEYKWENVPNNIPILSTLSKTNKQIRKKGYLFLPSPYVRWRRNWNVNAGGKRANERVLVPLHSKSLFMLQGQELQKNQHFRQVAGCRKKSGHELPSVKEKEISKSSACHSLIDRCHSRIKTLFQQPVIFQNYWAITCLVFSAVWDLKFIWVFLFFFFLFVFIYCLIASTFKHRR